MEFTKETVDKLADLLMIGLSPEENKLVLDEFELIDNDINKINKIEGINDAKPMTHALDDFEFELRCDNATDSPSTTDLLSNCDKVSGFEVEVPKVVE